MLFSQFFFFLPLSFHKNFNLVYYVFHISIFQYKSIIRWNALFKQEKHTFLRVTRGSACSGNIFSLMECYRENKVNPKRWMQEVLIRVQDKEGEEKYGYSDWLPFNFIVIWNEKRTRPNAYFLLRENYYNHLFVCLCRI